MENPLEIRVAKVVEDGRNSPFLRWENQSPKSRCQGPMALFRESGGLDAGGNDMPLWPQRDLTTDAYRLPKTSLKLNTEATRMGQAIWLWPRAPNYKARKPPQK